MGSQHSNPSNNTQFNINDWTQLHQEAGFRVLSNRFNPRLQIQQHELVMHNNRDLQFAEQVFGMRKYDGCLVSAVSYVFLDQHNARFHRIASGLIYTERVLFRLPQVSPVPFPHCLHIFAQTIYGCEKLSKYFGFFKINPYCIGINTDNIAKVWHNPNFAQIHPHQIAYSEQQMMFSILDAVQPFVDFQTMPRQEPSFKYFVLKRTHRLGFEVLKSKLSQFARYFCQGTIPNHLSLNARGHQHTLQTQNQPPTLNLHQTNKSINNQQQQLNLSRAGTQNHNPIFTPTQTSNKPLIFSRQPISYQPRRHILQQNTPIEKQPINRVIHPNNNNNNIQQFMPLPLPLVPNTIKVQGQVFQTNTHNQIPGVRLAVNNNQFTNHNLNFHPQANQNIHHIRPNSVYNQFHPTLGRSNISQVSSKRSNSVQSQRIQIRDKPLSSTQSNPNHFNSFQSLNLNNQLITRQRSHSELKGQNNPVFVSFMNNSVEPTRNQNRYFGNHMNGPGLIKPVSIKQSIQGVQYRNKDNIKTPSSMIVPIIHYEVPAVHPSINLPLPPNHYQQLGNNTNLQQIPKVSQSPKFGEPLKDPWETIMKIVSSKPNPEAFEPAQNTEVIVSPRPQIEVEEQQESQNEKANPAIQTQLIQKPIDKPKVKFDIGLHNQSVSSIGSPSLYVKNLYDAKESESINNSSRNFYYNFEGEEFSQLAELSNPLDFTLSKKQRSNSFKLDTKQNDFKKIQINDEFTSLDLMKKLKITQTIRKDEQDSDRLEISDDDSDKIMKQRSRSKQFSEEIEKLGFDVNYQDNQDDEPDPSPIQSKKKSEIFKELIYEWTPSYNEKYEIQSSNFQKNYNRDQKEPLSEQKYGYKYSEPSFETKYPPSVQYTNFQHVPQEQYRYEWDPELLADIQSKAYNDSATD